MKTIALIGAGKIGRMVAHFLGGCGDYSIRVIDLSQSAVDLICTKARNCTGTASDFTDPANLDRIMVGADAVISCAPYHCNPLIAERAKANKLHYFDLTEDVKVTDQVITLAQDAETAFAPQCGLAPGFITIVAKHLLEPMTEVSDLRMRVGALPRYPDNRLKYNLTWSTEGLINEYCQPCEVLLDGISERLPRGEAFFGMGSVEAAAEVDLEAGQPVELVVEYTSEHGSFLNGAQVGLRREGSTRRRDEGQGRPREPGAGHRPGQS